MERELVDFIIAYKVSFQICLKLNLFFYDRHTYNRVKNRDKKT